MAYPKTYDKIAQEADELNRTLPLCKVGEILGVSNSRLHVIRQKAKRDATMPIWTAGLDVRTANILLAAGFTDPDEVREAIYEGREIPWLKEGRQKIVKKWLRPRSEW